jgi:hypothetical protein
MNAHPERDIDSTPPARPTPSSQPRIAWAIWIVHVSDDAQDRLTVAAGTESGKPAASAAQRDVSRPLVCDVHAPAGDVLDPIQGYADVLAGPGHRLTEQVIDLDVRQGAAIAANRGAYTTENECVSHGSDPPQSEDSLR